MYNYIMIIKLPDMRHVHAEAGCLSWVIAEILFQSILYSLVSQSGARPHNPITTGKPLVKENVGGFEYSGNYTCKKETKLLKTEDLTHCLKFQEFQDAA